MTDDPPFFAAGTTDEHRKWWRRHWHQAPGRNPDRNASVVARWIAGVHLTDIAAEFGVTEVRVMQITHRVNVVRFQRVGPRTNRPPAVDYDAAIQKGEPGECWIWQGARTTGGYGVWRKRRTHRIALERKLGRVLASNEHACHTCDNPPCCNPDHLYVGDAVQNARDRLARGRSNSRRPDGVTPI